MTDDIRAALLKNGRRFVADPDFDPPPVVKYFTPDAACTWLIASAEQEGEDTILYGLCYLGVGFPELGTVLLSDLEEIRGIFRMAVERDLYFVGRQPLSAYASRAFAANAIVG